MRFLLSLIIWTVIVGGLFVYTWQRDAGLPQGPSIVDAPEHVKSSHRLEITPTFSVEKDPFALQSDTQDAALIELKLNGKNLDVPFVEMRGGKVIQIRDLQELQVGFNEFYISASPPITENMLDHGMRIKLLNGGRVVFDKTIWASHGALVSGTINFTLAMNKEAPHEH